MILPRTSLTVAALLASLSCAAAQEPANQPGGVAPNGNANGTSTTGSSYPRQSTSEGGPANAPVTTGGTVGSPIIGGGMSTGSTSAKGANSGPADGTTNAAGAGQP